jgi:hypothetical protein
MTWIDTNRELMVVEAIKSELRDGQGHQLELIPSADFNHRQVHCVELDRLKSELMGWRGQRRRSSTLELITLLESSSNLVYHTFLRPPHGFREEFHGQSSLEMPTSSHIWISSRVFIKIFYIVNFVNEITSLFAKISFHGVRTSSLFRALLYLGVLWGNSRQTSHRMDANVLNFHSSLCKCPFFYYAPQVVLLTSH